jgi:hypothetical protein
MKMRKIPTKGMDYSTLTDTTRKAGSPKTWKKVRKKYGNGECTKVVEHEENNTKELKIWTERVSLPRKRLDYGSLSGR